MRFLLKQLGDPKPDGRPPEPDKAGGEAAPGPGTGTGEQADSPAGGPAGPPRTDPRRRRPGTVGPAEGGTAEPPPTAPPPVAFTWTEYRAFETLTPFLGTTRGGSSGSSTSTGSCEPCGSGRQHAGFRKSARHDPLAGAGGSVAVRRERDAAPVREASRRVGGRLVERARRRPADLPHGRGRAGSFEEEAPGTGRRRRAPDELLECQHGRLSWSSSSRCAGTRSTSTRRSRKRCAPVSSSPRRRARRTARSPRRPCRPRTVDSPRAPHRPPPRDCGGGLVGYRRHPPEARHRRRHARDDPRLPVRGRLRARARLARRHGRSRRDGGRGRAAGGRYSSSSSSRSRATSSSSRASRTRARDRSRPRS